MDKVEGGLFQWVELVLFSIGFGNGRADENFTQKGGGIFSWKGDAVSRGRVIKKTGVEVANGLFRDEVDGDFFGGYFIKLE